MKILICITLFSLGICSCISRHSSNTLGSGVYVAKDILKGRIWMDSSHYPFLESIIYLSPDSTFAINTDICSGYGKWYMENDSLVLDASDSYKNQWEYILASGIFYGKKSFAIKNGCIYNGRTKYKPREYQSSKMPVTINAMDSVKFLNDHRFFLHKLKCIFNSTD